MKVDIYLRELELADVTSTYVQWLNDCYVNKYLESRFVSHTLDTVSLFVDSCIRSKNVKLFGIFTLDHQHIGNIKLDINPFHQTAEIGLLIGDRNFWGRGVATQAIEKISKYATELKLFKLTAGCYCSNLGSEHAFLKSGFHEESRLKNQVLIDGKRQSILRFAKFIEVNI